MILLAITISLMSFFTLFIDPFLIGAAILIFMGLIFPIVLNVVGLSLIVAFDYLTLTMGYDILALLVSDPTTILRDVELLTEGQLTPYLQNLED